MQVIGPRSAAWKLPAAFTQYGSGNGMLRFFEVKSHLPNNNLT
jgi:hypothetical protein